jgi:hypothetical protein
MGLAGGREVRGECAGLAWQVGLGRSCSIWVFALAFLLFSKYVPLQMKTAAILDWGLN